RSRCTSNSVGVDSGVQSPRKLARPKKSAPPQLQGPRRDWSSALFGSHCQERPSIPP
ncbi:hypothetical protein HAX54_027092, partial [Datura stramonium]|nr:hypothetical protein [Datura stramonium]